MDDDINNLLVMVNNITIDNKSIYRFSRQSILSDKKKLAKIFNKINNVNQSLINKRGINQSLDIDMCRFIRLNVYQQMLKIKRDIAFNINRNINEVNEYKIAYHVKKDMIKNDKDLQKREKYKKWRKIKNKKIKQKIKEKKNNKMQSNQSDKKNTRLGSLHRFINREKYVPPTDIPSVRNELSRYINNGTKNLFIPAMNIQRIFRGYITRLYIIEHLNVIIKRHIELNIIDDKYIQLPYKIKMTFASLVSGIVKKYKFNDWLTRILNKMNPENEYLIQNNIMTINILDKMNNGIVSKGYIYTHNSKGTITISNNDMKKMNIFLKEQNMTLDNMFIYTTSRISEQTMNKFEKNGIKKNNIFTMDNIIELIFSVKNII